MNGLKKTGFFNRVFLRRSTLPFYSGYTYYFLLRFSAVWGLAWGILLLGSMVLKKGLQASPESVGLLATFSYAAFLFGPFWSRFMRRFNPRRTIIVLSALGYLPLLLVSVTNSTAVFMIVAVAPYFVTSAVLPVRNAILERNYHPGIRGRAFGFTMSSWVIVCMFLSLLAGALLDWHSWLYRLLFPLAGVFGFSALLIFARVRVRRADLLTERFEDSQPPGPAKTFALSMLNMAGVLKTLKENRPFRRYQFSVFIYGIGFLMVEPVAVVFADNTLRVSYTLWTTARLVITPIMQMLCYPVWGRLMDRLGAPRTASLAYLLLSLWAAALFSSALFTSVPLLIAAYFLFGIPLSGVDLVWNLGCNQFADRRNPADIGNVIGVNSMLLGVQGMIAPWVGLGINSLWGPAAAFIVSAGLLAASSVLMALLGRRMAEAAGVNA